MGYRIDPDRGPYIHVTVDDILDKETVLAALGEVLNRPDYPERHTLWDLTGAEMRLTIQDMEEISGLLRLYKPVSPEFANRVALVVSSPMELGMADIFIAVTTLLPFKYKAFLSFEDAKSFASG